MAAKPMGMLTKKIHCQDILSTIYPPITGPIEGPTIIPRLKMPLARALSLGGKVSNRIACEVDNSAPPPNPCKKRKATSSQRLLENPHKAEARVKRMIDPT